MSDDLAEAVERYRRNTYQRWGYENTLEGNPVLWASVGKERRAQDQEILARAYLSTLTAPTPVDWQPIETAPKDQENWIWVVEDETQFTAKWYDYDYRGTEWAGKIRGGDRYVGWRDGYGNECAPTHWRPLPAPPTLSRPKPQ